MFQHLAKTIDMVQVGVSQYHVIHVCCLIVSLYVLDQLVAGVEKAAINNVHGSRAVNRVADGDCVAALRRLDGEEVNFNEIGHGSPKLTKRSKTSLHPSHPAVNRMEYQRSNGWPEVAGGYRWKPLPGERQVSEADRRFESARPNGRKKRGPAETGRLPPLLPTSDLALTSLDSVITFTGAT